MIRKLTATALFGIVALAMLPNVAKSQNLRPEDTFFLKPRVGISWFLADNEQSPLNLNLDNWEVSGEFPWAAGIELGYQFDQHSSFSLGWQIVNHPLIFHAGPEVPQGVDISADGTIFNSVQALYRRGTAGRVAPFFTIGGHATFGSDSRSSTGFGPAAGLGVDIVLNDRLSLVGEWIGDMVFGDKALDGVDQNVFGKDFAPFDLSNSVTLGLKINFKSAFTPVQVLAVDCPGSIQVGESGTFTATVNADATQPVAITWDFGDGATGSGSTTTHTYSSAGDYTVTASANNGRASDSRTCTVTATPPPQPAEIVTVSADRTRFEVCTPQEVNFSANVRGKEPITYEWDFGDGSTGTGETPSHTYSDPGTYTVTLTATNEDGSSSRTLTVTAEACTSACYDITEMNSVFFNRNSSTLTEEARAALQENQDILLECPNICVRIEGFSGPGERNPQQLSEDRARAVERFYIDNGVVASRITTVGRGRVGGQTSKKEGTSQFRRADTIPMQCEDMQ